MSLPQVLFTLNVPRDHFSPLDGIADLVIEDYGVGAMPRDEVMARLATCEGLISQGELLVDEELLARAPRLRIVANAAMGYDNLDLDALRKRGIRASNTPEAFAESTADHAMGLLLALTRRLAEADRYVRSGQWAEHGMQPLRWESRLASSLTLGLLGYGRIAQRVEKRAAAFGMEVLHTRSSPSNHPNFRDLDTLLSQSDILIILVPLKEKTRHLVDAAMLSKMKAGARLINMARGKVMDENAVVQALQTGHLSGAAFDVFENEPQVSAAFFDMENVVLTPHSAGATVEERRAGRIEAAENVARYLKGQELLSPVV